jgi:MYXO-CTERM domain-containing protein
MIETPGKPGTMVLFALGVATLAASRRRKVQA